MKNRSKFNEEFQARLRSARQSAGYSQQEFAKKLGIERDTYAKYERRSDLPLNLLAEVCLLTGHTPWFFLTGQPRMPSLNTHTNIDEVSQSHLKAAHK